MAGYFSQLAKSTGLSFEPQPPVAHSPVSAAPGTSSRDLSEPASLSAIDEVAFVPASPEARLRDTSRANEDSESEATPLPLSSESAARIIDAPTTTHVTAEMKSRADAQLTDTPAGESIVVTDAAVTENYSRSISTADKPGNEKQAMPTGPETSPAKATVGERVVGDQAAIRSFETGNVSITQREELLTTLLGTQPENAEQNVTVRNYLKEVLAWVANPPEQDQPQPSSLTANPAIPEKLEIQISDDRSPLAQPVVTEPMVQDLNLSIGNISIVVEEPKPNVTAQVATPLQNERVAASETSEPTRLSRYYLRSW